MDQAVTGPEGGKLRASAPWIILIIAAVLPFLGSLANGFVFDDPPLILDNPAVQASGPARVFTAPYWYSLPNCGLYRPWTTFTFWLDTRMFGRHAAGFHAVNLILNALVTLLVWRVLRRLFPERPAVAFAASLLFAFHPLHSEAVVNIAGRAELWAAFGALLAYLLALRGVRGGGSGWIVASAAPYTLALFSKENSVGMMLLPVLHLLFPDLPGKAPARADARERRSWIHVLAAWGIPILFLLIARIRVLGGLVSLEQVNLSDNVLTRVPVWERIPSALGFQWILIGRLLFPLQLSADYSYPQLHPSPAWMAAGVGLLLLGAWGAMVILRRGDRPMIWGAGFILATGALTANVLMAIGTVLGERLAYLPSVGALWLLCLGGARLFEALEGRRPERAGGGGAAGGDGAAGGGGAGGGASARPGRISFPASTAGRVLAAVALLWGSGLVVRSILRTPDWKSNLTLFEATVKASPRSSKTRSNLAACLVLDKRVKEGLAQSREAVRLMPDNPGAYEILGGALLQDGQPEEALKVLLPMVPARQQRPEFFLQLGNVHLELNHGVEADSAFRIASRYLPEKDARVAIGLASAWSLEGKLEDSRRMWRRAAQLSPKDDRVHRSWAYSIWQTGDADSAEIVYRSTYARKPDDPANQNDLAWFLATSRRNPREAVSLARKAYAKEPSDTYADTLLECLLAADGCGAARAWADSLDQGLIRRGGKVPEAVRRKLEERCSAARRST